MKALRVLGCAAMAGLLLTSTAAAQRPAPKFGVLGGVNFATISGNDAEDVSSKTSFFGGLYAELGLARSISFRPEVLYSRKGAESNDPGFDVELKIGYIEVPLLLQWRQPPASESQWALSPHLYLGPAVAFQLSCEGSSGGIDVDCDQIFDEAKSVDFSGIVGGGLSFGALQVGVRYVYGFVNLFEDAGESIDAKNRVFSAYLGWSF